MALKAGGGWGCSGGVVGEVSGWWVRSEVGTAVVGGVGG